MSVVRLRVVSSLLRSSRVVSRPSKAVWLSCSTRPYAQSWDGRKPNEKIDAHLKVQRLMDDIHAHPQVMEKLQVVSEIMITKGLASENAAKPLGPWQMIKILMDKDLKVAMNDFKEELEKAGINLGPDQLGPLMTVLGIEKKKDN